MSRIMLRVLMMVAATLSGGNLWGQAGFKYFPHLVYGGGSNARIGFQNLDDEPITVSYTMVRRDGETVALGGIAEVPPQGVRFFPFEDILAQRGEDLDNPQVYWLRLHAERDYGATGIQTLQVGALTLLPYGILPVTPCRRSGVIVSETERVRVGLALMNSLAEAPISCHLRLTEGREAASVAETTIEVPARSQTAFFLEDRMSYDPGISDRGLIIQCDDQVFVYSLQQDRSTGDTNAVAATCSSPN